MKHLGWIEVIQAGKHGHVGRKLHRPAAVSVVVSLLMTTALVAIGRAAGAAGSWTPAPSMSTPRFGFNFAPLLPDGRVLASGGVNQAGTVLASAELYDPATNTWSPAASMIAPRGEQTSTLLQNGKVLVVGGSTTRGSSPARSCTTRPPTPGRPRGASAWPATGTPPRSSSTGRSSSRAATTGPT